MLQEIMAGWLGVEVGGYFHLSDSLHVYQRHWEYAEEILKNRQSPKPSTDDLRLSWDRFWETFERLELAFLNFPDATKWEDMRGFFDNLQPDMPIGYRNILRILAAEALRVADRDVEARGLAESCENHALRTSWLRWSLSKG
jgi:thymidylate synthase